MIGSIKLISCSESKQFKFKNFQQEIFIPPALGLLARDLTYLNHSILIG